MKPLMKVLIAITIVCAIVFVAFIIECIFQNTNIFPNGLPMKISTKIVVGNMLFEEEFCSINGDMIKYLEDTHLMGGDPEHPAFTATAIVEERCNICKRIYTGGINSTIICEECSKITNRCDRCGKSIKLDK